MSVQINFTDATATTNSVKFALVDGSATYILESSKGVALNGTFTFSTLSVTQTSLAFGVSAGASFLGSITLDVKPTSSNPPVILVSNLSVDGATVTYPTADGPETQVLTPGQEMTLSGFVVD